MKKYSLLIQQYRRQDMKNVHSDELNESLQEANCCSIDCDCCDGLDDFYDNICSCCSCDCYDCSCCESCEDCELCSCERHLCEGCCECYDTCDDCCY